MNKKFLLILFTLSISAIIILQPIAILSQTQHAASTSGKQTSLPGLAAQSFGQPSSVVYHNRSLSSYGYSNAVAIANSSEIPSKYLYLPNMNSAGKKASGTYSPSYTQSPAPVGIADYGTAGSYSTTSFNGTISVNNMTPLYVLNDAPTSLGVQLNAILSGVSVGQSNTGVYWTQNVLFYSARQHQLQFIDNIWNFSSPGAGMNNSTLYSHGPNGTVIPNSLYYAVGGTINVTYPFTVALYLNSTLNGGKQEVFFNYSVSEGAKGGSMISGSFDYAVFNSSYKVSSPAQYLVNGAQSVPIASIPYDVEFVLGGPGGGSTTSLYGTNASMTLEYMSGGSYTTVKSAYDAGSDTGETANGIAVSWNQTDRVNLTAGPTFVYGMWGISTSSAMSTYKGTVNPSEAFMFVSPGGQFLNSTAAWVPLKTDGSYSFTIPTESSGYYQTGIFSNWYNPMYGTLGSSTVLTENRTRGIYAPIYAIGNQQLKDLSTLSTGTLTAPYVISGQQNASIYPIFGKFNDYAFPLFPGVLISGTTAPVKLQGIPSFYIQYSASVQSELSFFTLPPLNYMNFEFYNDTNITLNGSSFISGWFSYTLAGYFPAADVLLWNTTNSLISSNFFSSMDSSVLVYNSNNTKSNNTIWGNYFGQNSLVQSGYYSSFNTVGAPAGLTLFSSGNIVYNNNFEVYFTALSPNVSIYTGLESNYTNHWNITKEPVSFLKVVNGITLTGGIMDTGPNPITYQGGNFWWNYLGNGTSLYNDSGLIYSGGDKAPLTLHVFGVTFQEKGIPQGTRWYAILGNGSIAVSTTGSELSFYEPNGTYYVEIYARDYFANQSSGFLVVAGMNQSINLSFSKLFSLTFVENGLPSGDLWSVTVDGVTGYSVSNSIQYLATNGSLSYTLNGAGGYKPEIQTGQLIIIGQNRTVQANYLPFTYQVSFSESGLPPGTQWGIFILGQNVDTTSTSLTANVPNGTYGYTVTGATGYTPSIQYGEVSVNNGTNAVSISFSSNIYTLTFFETGLPAGSNWTVNIGSKHIVTTNSTIDIRESTGIYNYTVTGPSGYAASVKAGSVQVDKNLSVSVSFSNKSGIGLYQALDYALFGGSVAILGYTFYRLRKLK